MLSSHIWNSHSPSKYMFIEYGILSWSTEVKKYWIPQPMQSNLSLAQIERHQALRGAELHVFWCHPGLLLQLQIHVLCLKSKDFFFLSQYLFWMNIFKCSFRLSNIYDLIHCLENFILSPLYRDTITCKLLAEYFYVLPLNS